MYQFFNGGFLNFDVLNFLISVITIFVIILMKFKKFRRVLKKNKQDNNTVCAEKNNTLTGYC